MKKVFIMVGSILFLPLIAVGTYIGEEFYYQTMSFKAEKAASNYLEKKYGESFRIEEINYSKALGDENGWYDIYAHPIEKRDISISVTSNEKFEVTYDNYKEMKWRNDAILEYKEMVKEYFTGYSDLYVNMTFPEDILKKYKIENTYKKIFTENPNLRDEYVYILSFAEKKSFNSLIESAKIYRLWSDIIGRKVKNYTIVVKYFPSELEDKFNTYSNSNDFENKHWRETLYSCRFSSEDVQKNLIKSEEDVTKFCKQ